MEFVPSAPQHLVLCADCGTPIQPNGANLCLSCLKNSVDITEGIPKQATINFCRNCERYLNPPNSWVLAELESRELLAICLKKLKGLNKVRLIDAGFIWTEPHSKRLRVKLTVQKEVLTATILQQIFEIEFVVAYGQCPDCTRLAAKNTWKAQVQVRQKVPHKRTFLYLEQLILKHNAHRDTINVQETKDGLDFFYAQRAHAIKMIDFFNAVVPVRTKSSERLISADVHSSTTNHKFTYSVEIVPICKDDLVCLPLKLARSMGNIGQLTLCHRVGNTIHLIDPITLQTADVTSPIYWRMPFDSLATVGDLVEFTVADVVPEGRTLGKFALAEIEVIGPDGSELRTLSHLGGILLPGDTVMGYYLSSTNFNNENWDEFTSRSSSNGYVPDVVLAKKSYPNRRKKSRPRNWRLKSIAKEADESAGFGDAPADRGAGRGALGRRGGLDAQRVERDYELFLRDLEEDEEMRANVNLYKAAKVADGVDAPMEGQKSGVSRPSKAARRKAARQAQLGMANVPPSDEMDEDEDGRAETATTDGGRDDDGFPEIDVSELLDDMEGMQIEDDDEAEVY